MPQNQEAIRLQDSRSANTPWKWGPYLSERQWVQFAKITAPMAMPGTTSVMTRLDRAPITGAKTALPASAMTNSICASAWRFGMAMIQS